MLQLKSADLADVIEESAPLAAAKLRRLRYSTSAAYGALRMTLDAMQEQRENRIQAELRIKHVKRPPSGIAVRDESTSVRDAQRALDGAIAETNRLAPIHKAQQALWNVRGNIVRVNEECIRTILSTGAKVLDVSTVVPVLKKGETAFDGIHRIRRRVRELLADRHRWKSASTPSAVAMQRMRAYVNAVAEAGRPNVSDMIEHGTSEVQFVSQPMRAIARGETVAQVAWSQADVLALTVWLHKDALIAALDAEIMTEADDQNALDDVSRAQKVEQIEKDLAAVEAEEAALVWLALDNGLAVEHRSDISPQALLGVRPAEPVTAPDAQPSSPGRAGWFMR